MIQFVNDSIDLKKKKKNPITCRLCNDGTQKRGTGSISRDLQDWSIFSRIQTNKGHMFETFSFFHCYMYLFIPNCCNIGQFFHLASPRSSSNRLLLFLPADGLYALSFSISSLTLIGMLAVITYTVSWDLRQLFNVASCEHLSYICTVINASFKQDYCQIPLSKKINDTTKMLLNTKRGSFFFQIYPRRCNRVWMKISNIYYMVFFCAVVIYRMAFRSHYCR